MSSSVGSSSPGDGGSVSDVLHEQFWTLLRGFDMSMSLERRAYLVGETVTILIRVAEIGTSKPVEIDSITLERFHREGDEEDLDIDLDIESDDELGAHWIRFQTEGLQPGVYEVGFKTVSGSHVVIKRDRFVLS